MPGCVFWLVGLVLTSARDCATSTTMRLFSPSLMPALALASRYLASGLSSLTIEPPTSVLSVGLNCASAPSTQNGLPPWSTS